MGITPWRVFRIKVNDPEGDKQNEERFVHKIPVNVIWDTVGIHSQLNADIRTIYEQQYLAPRPNTISVRLGTDGYSPWTFPHWKSLPPSINLDQVNRLLDNKNKLNCRKLFSWEKTVAQCC